MFESSRGHAARSGNRRQRRLVVDVAQADVRRLEQCVEEARRGRRPAALLTELLRRPPAGQDAGDEEAKCDRDIANAVEWFQRIGHTHPANDQVEELRRLFPAVPAEMVDVIRQGNTQQGAGGQLSMLDVCGPSGSRS